MMDRRPTLEELLKSNTQIDPEELAQALEALRQLRSKGLRKARYGLATPDTTRRVAVGAGGDDRRMVRLGRERASLP